MGLYRRFLAPRVVDTICSPRALGKWRARVVEELSGNVIEIGFGAGRNLEYYPRDVTTITAIEPSSVMRQRAQGRIAASAQTVTFGGLDGQKLDLPDASFDAAVVTFSLCTIPDPASALAEVHRVLVPGGIYCFVEHVRALESGPARVQDLITPIWRRVAGGCHPNRDSAAAIEAAGFRILSCTRTSMPKAPRPLRPTIHGHAERG